MVMKNFHKIHVLTLTALALLIHAATSPAELNTNANIAVTKHNLSTSGPGTTKASGEDQICVFCHTPHAANATAPAPLWNRKMGGAADNSTTYSATYIPYTSASLDAEKIFGALSAPGGSSKLCLSCHDGTLALGTVGVLDGKSNPATVAGLSGTMPTGLGATTGFTRNLGVDLRNDHPISFTFNQTLAIGDTTPDPDIVGDGELRTPPYSVVFNGETRTVVGPRSSGVKPMLPLDHEGKVQCTSCHDPHLDASRFLRLNRLQKASPAGGDFNVANDQICLGCHDKLGTTWSNSAHANSTVADEVYTASAAAANRRDFLVNGSPAKVWEVGCLNCHDTHSVQGSRRLLREGVNTSATGSDSGVYKDGYTGDPATSSAIEETCYQCHQGGATRVITTGDGTAPNIKTEFETRSRRMPIVTAAQGGNTGSTEVHDITNSDFVETPAKLGSGNHGNRHVECTDCHNPHRVLRNSLFNGQGDNTLRTHKVGSENTSALDGNLASGVLRGQWGVEPTYGTFTGAWPDLPSNYIVKSGDPRAVTDTARTKSYLTREYQLCFKCHSDYGGTSGGTMPAMGYTGGTPSSANNFSTGNTGANSGKYTNIAAEFGVNARDYTTNLASLNNTHQCEAGTGNDTSCTPTGGAWGAVATDTKNTTTTTDDTTFDITNASTHNHRSWHPVHYPTGRTATERSNSGSSGDANFKTPFKTGLGIQTMHCSDCHGNAASWQDGVGPFANQVQGPHGSDNNFLLKGTWDSTTRNGNISAVNDNTGGLCGNCHVGDVSRTQSGFGAADTSGHSSDEHGKACGRCHIAVPHGWKNKAFLVNLNCVGPEGGASGECISNRVSSQGSLTYGPYYVQSVLRVRTWQASRNWSEGSCGSPSASGESWMDGTC